MRIDIGETMSSSDVSKVLKALKVTSKGKLTYDTNWKEDGRTEEIVNSIKQSVSSISLAPRSSISLENNTKGTFNGIKSTSLTSSNGAIGTASKLHSFDNSIEYYYPKSLKIIDDEVSTSSDKDEIELIKNYEQERNDKVLKNSEQYTNKLLEKNENIMETVEGEMRLIQKKYLLLAIQNQKKYEEECAQLQKELEQQLTKSTITEQSGTSVNKGANLRLKEIEERHKLLMKQEEMKRLEQQQFKLTLSNCKELINKTVLDCEQHQQEHLYLQMTPNVTDELQHFKTLLLGLVQDMDVLLLTKSVFTADDVQFGYNRQQESIKIKQRFFDVVQQQVAKFKPVAPLNVSTTASQVKEPTKLQPNAQPATTTTVKPTSDSTKSKVSQRTDEFSEAPANIYIRTQLELVEFEEKCNSFSQNNANKQRRGELQRFVRTTINQVCNQPVNKLAEKAVRLLRLLSGQDQEDRTVKIRCHHEDNSLYFTINDAAKSFLNVSVKQKNMAVKLAPVVVFIWARVPLFGKIFLAQLFRNCPYAVPYYPSMGEGQSEVEYMVTCGYQLNSEGQITESDEIFHERTFAMIQLYSAVIQCNMTKGHPRDLHYAWNWLARVLNDTPKPRLTALMLDAFLSVSAHKLLRIYGKQFAKIIRYIKGVYLKKISDVTPSEKQTMMKLTTLIDQVYHKMNTSRDAVRELAQTLDLVPDFFFS